MAFEVVYKKPFYKKLEALLNYLQKEWNEDIAQKFLIKLDNRISTLTEQPYIGSPSRKVVGVRGILITKHNKIFYKVSKNRVTIIDMLDTRIDPQKNRYL